MAKTPLLLVINQLKNLQCDFLFFANVFLFNSFQLKPKVVLSKYDEEIEGEKKKSFRLSAGGFVGGERERELQGIRENLRNQAQSLDMPALSLASEYYTPNEMVRIIWLSALGLNLIAFLTDNFFMTCVTPGWL